MMKVVPFAVMILAACGQEPIEVTTKNVADYGRRTPRRLGVTDRLIARGVFERGN